MTNFSAIGRLADTMSKGLPPLKSRMLITQVVGILTQSALEEAPERQGELKQGIQERVDSPYSGHIDFQAPHTPFVYYGTKPHIILPKFALRSSAKEIGGGSATLRFQIGGRVLYRKFVRHPGTRPNRFIDRAVDRSQPAVAKAGEGWMVDVATAVTK
jgi:hypothetical protein